jgi:subtilisin family serine protease
MPAPSIRIIRIPLALALAAAAIGSAACGRVLPTASSGARAAVAHAPAGASQAALADPADVVVTLAPGVSGQTLSDELGATLLAGSTSLCARLLPGGTETCDELVLRLTGDSRVITAERDAVLESAEARQESYASDDGLGTLQTYLVQEAGSAIGLVGAHTVSAGNGVTIAVLDTGVDPQHPAIATHLVQGYDFVDGDANATDQPDGIDNDGDGQIDEAYGHGTHVTGILALTAPGASLMPIRVLDADGHGTIATVATGIQYALDHGARVLSLSLGMLRNSDAIQNMLDDAQRRGVVIVCSAGNWGAENPREYPAASSHASAIAATDALAQPATFTSYGSQVALCAPGVGVRSAYPGGGWRLWSGTSMSAPFVAGTAALLLSLHPAWTSAQVFDRLAQTAKPLVNVPPTEVGKLGGGMLDAAAALLPDLHSGGGNTNEIAPDVTGKVPRGRKLPG